MNQTMNPLADALEAILARIARQNGYDLAKVRADLATEREVRR